MKITEAEIISIIKECVLNIVKENKTLKEGITIDNPSPNKFGYLVNRYGAKKVLNTILEWMDPSLQEEYIQWFEQEGWFDNEDYD